MYEVASYGNFGPEIALTEWETAFGCIAQSGPRDVAYDGSSFVFAASAGLQAALVAASKDEVAQAAARWVELHADGDEEIPAEFADDVLSEIASLARTATGRGHQLYCWWG